MIPPVGCSRSSTIFAVVVLPQPDSPTSPNVLPGSIVNEMSSTARTAPTWREKKTPCLTGKCSVRVLASRTGPAIGVHAHLDPGAASQQRLVCRSASADARVEDQRAVADLARDARPARAHLVRGEMPKLEERAGDR